VWRTNILCLRSMYESIGIQIEFLYAHTYTPCSFANSTAKWHHLSLKYKKLALESLIAHADPAGGRAGAARMH
jgi:hypothetical protein